MKKKYYRGDNIKSLQVKIFLITSITISILVGVFFVFEFNKDKKYIYEQQVINMKENSFTIRNSIESVSIPMLIQSILEEYAQNILNNRDTKDIGERDPFEIPPHEIHAVNIDGMVMASTKPELIGQMLADVTQNKETGLNEVLEGKEPYSVEQMEHHGVKVFDFSVPIRENGKIIGALHYVEPYMKLEKMNRESFIRHIIFALILIILLSLFINFFLNKMVTNPIEELSDAMDKIRLSEAGEEIAVSTKDEIGLLSHSFNKMYHALKEREDEIKKYTTTLEEMVEERTSELQQSHAQLIQTEKLASMGRLAGYIAHEINNPIGVIVSRAECILMDADEKKYSDLLIKDIEVIRKHSNRIGTIARSILAFARKSPMEFSFTDINKIIDETLVLLEKQFSQNNICFKKNMDYTLPVVYGNSNQLQHVFFNIFYNARDAMPEGGEISITSRLNGDSNIHILISDNGIGIPEQNLAEVFDPFFTTKKDEKGTGLGLSVVYGIIKSHKGEINVTSRVDEGTTFEIQLPLKNDTSGEA